MFLINIIHIPSRLVQFTVISFVFVDNSIFFQIQPVAYLLQNLYTAYVATLLILQAFSVDRLFCIVLFLMVNLHVLFYNFITFPFSYTVNINRTKYILSLIIDMIRL